MAGKRRWFSDVSSKCFPVILCEKTNSSIPHLCCRLHMVDTGLSAGSERDRLCSIFSPAGLRRSGMVTHPPKLFSGGRRLVSFHRARRLARLPDASDDCELDACACSPGR